ncbi:MAG: GAF domain-containing protein [Lewinellaceae bacterium]|nr:GAF domain-containing protein [Lewinellaceae bacterium]
MTAIHPTSPGPAVQPAGASTPETGTALEIMPYASRLSFLPLIHHLKEQASREERPGRASLLQFILDKVEQAPVLLQPVDNLGALESHVDLVDLLLSTVFPDGQEAFSLGRAFKPLDVNAIYQTEALRRLLREDGCFEYCLDGQPDRVSSFIINAACSIILNKFYGQALKVEAPLTATLRLPGQALERHFKCVHNLSFIDVLPVKPLPKLSSRQINQLVNDPMNWRQWLEYLPPDRFEFQGFIAEYHTEITEEAALSRIRYQLLEKDVVVDPQKIAHLEELVRTALQKPAIRLGLSATNEKGNLCSARKYKVAHPLLGQVEEDFFQTEDCIYQQALQQQEPLLVEDLTQLEEATEVEAELLNSGIRSIIIFPLRNKKGKLAGFLELGAAEAHALSKVTALKAAELAPLFTLAIERRREELNNEVEAIIREQYTTLHPSVEWQFLENAFALLEERSKGRKGTARPIVFKEVYPLYAQADIVNSSNIRNAAIQADLLDNLRRLEKALLAISGLLPFPIVEQFLFRAREYASCLRESFSSNDESRVMEFLRQEAHPLLRQMGQHSPEAVRLAEAYFRQLDPRLGVVYNKRKAYEDSVAMINEYISRHLEQEDEAAQEMLPHYFEKYKTDGVEFEIYAGQSLLPKGQFDILQLSNLRLWQLMAMCTVTRQLAELKKQLPLPLDTAQMIFVYSNPIDIRFRMDEKRFDVDGAYNIRYEIIKKRVDKALVDGTEERLRAPGKLAIVYAAEKDRIEYMEYLRFLASRKLILPDIEELPIGKLQGVEGLRALRVTVDVGEQCCEG